MEQASLSKTISIIIDPIKGEIDYELDGNIMYAEALGAIEYVKMMVMKEWLDDNADD